jgi:hypothetical protein
VKTSRAPARWRRRTMEGESPGQAREGRSHMGTCLCAPPWLEHRYSSARV